MVTARSLKKFVEAGGYNICKKQPDGTFLGIAEAARKTGLGEMTIRRIMKEHPIHPMPTARIFFLNETDCQVLRGIELKISEAEKLVCSTESFLDKYLLVDMQAVRSRQAYQGLSEEDAFRTELNNSGNMDSKLKRELAEISQKLSSILSEMEKIRPKEQVW
jgi:hypothetical protein